MPVSLNCGNVMLAVRLALAAGGITETPEVVAYTPEEGLSKFTWKLATPDRSSVAEKFTVIVAGPVAVLIVLGLKLKAVRTGGVTSWICDQECEGNRHERLATTRAIVPFERRQEFMGWASVQTILYAS